MRFLPLLLVLAGCSYATTRAALLKDKPERLGLPAAQFDAAASELTVVGVPENIQPQSEYGQQFKKSRDDLAALLTEVLAEQGSPQKARYKAIISSEVNIVPMFFPCLIIFALADCPAAKLNLHLDLTLQVGARSYAGSGDGASWIILFGADSQQGDHDVGTEATGRALADALRNLHESAR